MLKLTVDACSVSSLEQIVIYIGLGLCVNFASPRDLLVMQTYCCRRCC